MYIARLFLHDNFCATLFITCELLGFTSIRISDLIVLRSTIYRRVRELNLEQVIGYSDITGTSCSRHSMLTSQHAHVTACSRHSMLTSQHAHVTACQHLHGMTCVDGVRISAWLTSCVPVKTSHNLFIES